MPDQPDQSDSIARTGMGGHRHSPEGCHWSGRPHLGPCVERSTEGGVALSLVRQVAAQAQAALDDLRGEALEHHLLPPARHHPRDTGARIDRTRPTFHDPDRAQMREALMQVVGLLAPWRRTGEITRWVTDDGPSELLPDADAAQLYKTLIVDDDHLAAAQATCDELRDRAIARFSWNSYLQNAVVALVDELMREMLDEARRDKDGSF